MFPLASCFSNFRRLPQACKLLPASSTRRERGGVLQGPTTATHLVRRVALLLMQLALQASRVRNVCVYYLLYNLSSRRHLRADISLRAVSRTDEIKALDVALQGVLLLYMLCSSAKFVCVVQEQASRAATCTRQAHDSRLQPVCLHRRCALVSPLFRPACPSHLSSENAALRLHHSSGVYALSFQSFSLKPKKSDAVDEKADKTTTRVRLYSSGFMVRPDTLLGEFSSCRTEPDTRLAWRSHPAVVVCPLRR